MAKAVRGLGKGLDSLIPASVPKVESVQESVKTEDNTQGTYVKITKVEPNREQPRKNFDEDSLIELSDSIKQVGILQPIVVQKRDDFYEIIAGERRWRAAKIAGLKEIPVIIKELSEQEILEVSIIENIQRERLNPIEEALAFKKLIKEFKLKQDEVAERVSKSRTAITNSMRLLKLDERVQQMVIDEMISTGHARALLSINTGERQFEIATKIFDEKLSVREVEKIVKSEQNKQEEKKTKKEKKDTLDYIYKDIADKIASAIGSKVEINSKGNGRGKIEIQYYSNDELERIKELICQ